MSIPEGVGVQEGGGEYVYLVAATTHVWLANGRYTSNWNTCCFFTKMDNYKQ